MSKNETEQPLPCPGCGHSQPRAEPLLRDRHYRVRCNAVMCWIGPSCETKAEAIAAWNEVAQRKPAHGYIDVDDLYEDGMTP